jgi:thiol-disulfide isomerase/thioredoxin
MALLKDSPSLFKWVLVGVSCLLLALSLYIIYGRYTDREATLSKNFSSLIPAMEGASYTDLEGNPISLTDFAGKVVLVYSWASWSPQCADELKRLSEFVASYDQDEFVILALNRKESRSVVYDYLTFIEKPGGLQYLLDPTDNAYVVTQGFAMPRATLYDTDGELIADWQGTLDMNLVRESVDAHI